MWRSSVSRSFVSVQFEELNKKGRAHKWTTLNLTVKMGPQVCATQLNKIMKNKWVQYLYIWMNFFRSCDSYVAISDVSIWGVVIWGVAFSGREPFVLENGREARAPVRIALQHSLNQVQGFVRNSVLNFDWSEFIVWFWGWINDVTILRWPFKMVYLEVRFW